MLDSPIDGGTALHTGDARFRILADSTPILLWVADTSGRCTFFNQHWLQFTGGTLEDELGDGWLRHLHPDDVAPNQQLFAEALRRRKPFRMEYRLRRFDGAYRWLLDNGTPRSNADGSFAGYIGSCVDVTERRELLTALQHKSIEQEVLLSTIPALVYFKDRDLRYVTVNQAFADLVRRPLESIAGLTDSDLFTADEAELYRRDDLAVLTAGRALPDIEERVTDAAGHTLWVSTHKTPYRDLDGRIVGLVGISIDISARKRAEEQLREQTETLATLNRVGAVLSAELDLPRLLQAVADAGCALTGAATGVFVYHATDEYGEQAVLLAFGGAPSPERVRQTPARRRQLVRAVARLGPLRLDDVAAAPASVPAALVALLDGSAPPRSLLALPVVSRQGETLGGLVLGHPEPGHFGAQHEHLGHSLAAQAAVAVDNARLYQAEQLARRLTERSGERLRRMHTISTELGEALTPRQVGEVIIEQAMLLPGAKLVMVAMLTNTGRELALISSLGYDHETLRSWQHFSADADVPLAEVVRSGEPRWMESTAERLRRYPHLVASYTAMSPAAWVSLPFTIEGRAVGGMSLGFDRVYTLSEDERTFLLAFGRQCGLALERARLYDAERVARRAAEAAEARLALLAEAGAVLGASLDAQRTLQDVVQLVAARIADWCWIDLRDAPAGLGRVVSYAAHSEAQAARAAIMAQRLVETAQTGAAEVLRSGVSQLYPAPAADAALPDDDGGAADLLRSLGATAALSVPLRSREHLLGVITIVATQPERSYGAADVALMEELGRRAGAALENARLYDEAQEAIQMRDDFLSIASHELKTPITSLQLQAQGLLRLAQRGTLAELAQERLVAKLGVIDAQTTRLTNLANELLDVTHIRAGRVSVGLEDLDLALVVREVAGRFDEQSAVSGSPIAVEAPATLPLWSDRSRLEQVLTNLLSNALKYGAGNPIVVSVERTATTARIVVRDAGIGIAPEHLERIFVRYERLVSPRNYGGLGLGLYIVRQIVEALGGSIRVVSELGVGSTFAVTLPLIAPQRPPTAP